MYLLGLIFVCVIHFLIIVVILKGIDDVTTLLDDNSMSLQAMSISR